MPDYDSTSVDVKPGREADRAAGPEDEARWVMAFVDRSDKEVRQPMLPIWEETLENYLVSPVWAQGGASQLVQYPYLEGRDVRGSGRNGYSTLKDPESHQVVETLLAEQMILLYGEQAFMRTKPVGYEDTDKSRVSTSLLHYIFRLEGHYRSLYEWKKDGHIFGTGIMEGGWHYKEEDQEFRSVEVIDELELTSEQILSAPVYDDYRMRPKDLMDFYPDTSGNRIADMLGVACRFTTTAMEARDMAERNLWDKAAVEKAVLNKLSEDSREKTDKNWRQGFDRPRTDKPHPDLMPLVGYVYYGAVPYKHSDGGRRRKVTVLCGERVASTRHVGRFPFFEYSVCPIQGRFYGVSPLETIRYTQSFADSLLMLISDAAARATYLQPIVDRNADVNIMQLQRFRPDKAVLADRVDAVQYLQYDPPLQHAQMSYLGAKQNMREGTGALGALQGLSDAPDRESATGFAGRFKQAKGRPEAQAQLTEREYLPPMAQHMLAECRRYLTGPALALRVGEDPAAVPLATILENYDVEFVGSRIEGSRSQRLQAYREIFAQGANPIAATLLPWAEMYQRYLKDLALYEEAAKVGADIRLHLMLQQAQAQGPNQMGGNGNGEQPSLPPSGLAPAQIAGGPVV